MGFQITGTPTEVKKVAASMDDVAPATAEKATPPPPPVEKKEEDKG